MTRLFLGVDGGQSSTVALIGDQTGRVLGVGRAGPCNHVQAHESRPKFVDAITGSVHQACSQGGLDPATVRFASACLGFSGGPADKEAILQEILRCDRIIVTHDAAIALSGALAGAPGVVVIAGTGSMAFGRNDWAQTARSGGWGYLFGDEGGAFDIVRRALRAALRNEEGWGPATSLRATFLEATGARDMNDVLHLFYAPEFPRPRVAALAPLVDAAATKGDQTAIAVLHEAADELAAFGGAVRSQLFGVQQSVAVSYLGGVFRSAMLLARFRETVESTEGSRVVAPTYGPAAGALLEAYRSADLAPMLTNLTAEKA